MDLMEAISSLVQFMNKSFRVAGAKAKQKHKISAFRWCFKKIWFAKEEKIKS